MNNSVLIYDDDNDILTVCKIILTQSNYRVETRSNNARLQEDILELEPDLILMDLWIPGIGGERAINLLKGDSTTAQIPVILFSANSEIEEIAQRTQANGFLKKPFEISILLRLLEMNIVTV